MISSHVNDRIIPLSFLIDELGEYDAGDIIGRGVTSIVFEKQGSDRVLLFTRDAVKTELYLQNGLGKLLSIMNDIQAPPISPDTNMPVFAIEMDRYSPEQDFNLQEQEAIRSIKWTLMELSLFTHKLEGSKNRNVSIIKSRTAFLNALDGEYPAGYMDTKMTEMGLDIARKTLLPLQDMDPSSFEFDITDDDYHSSRNGVVLIDPVVSSHIIEILDHDRKARMKKSAKPIQLAKNSQLIR